MIRKTSRLSEIEVWASAQNKGRRLRCFARAAKLTKAPDHLSRCPIAPGRALEAPLDGGNFRL